MPSEAISLLQIAMIETASARGLCLVRKFSVHGAALRVRFPLNAGMIVTLALRDGHEIAGKVRAVDGERVELDFIGDVDLAATLLHPRPAGAPREAVRVPIRMPVVLGAGSASYPGLTRNISLRGIGLEMEEDIDLTRGQEVQLHVDGLGYRESRIIWCHSGQVGLEFIVPLGFNVLDEWLRR